MPCHAHGFVLQRSPTSTLSGSRTDFGGDNGFWDLPKATRTFLSGERTSHARILQPHLPRQLRKRSALPPLDEEEIKGLKKLGEGVGASAAHAATAFARHGSAPVGPRLQGQRRAGKEQ